MIVRHPQPKQCPPSDQRWRTSRRITSAAEFNLFLPYHLMLVVLGSGRLSGPLLQEAIELRYGWDFALRLFIYSPHEILLNGARPLTVDVTEAEAA